MQQPKIIELERLDGTVGKFEIRQFSAMDGLKFVTQYPATLALGSTKVSTYQVSEKLVVEMFAYVSVILDNDIKIALSTRDLIDNHVGDLLTLENLMREMLDFNTRFFTSGSHLSFLTTVIRGVVNCLAEVNTETSQT